MSTVALQQTGNRRATNARVKNLINYFKKEGSMPVENKLLGDQMAEWAHNTWAFQTWSGMTRDEVKAYSEGLQYRRILSDEIKKDAKNVLGSLRCNPYAWIISDLLDQLINEGQPPLFVFCIARELARKEKGNLIHHGLLNSISNRPDNYGTLEVIRDVPEEPTADVEKVWSELDELREQPQSPPPTDAQNHIIVPSQNDSQDSWRNRQDPNRTLASTPTSELRAKRFVRKLWLKLEEKVNWEVLRLTQEARAAQIPKVQLWERQNRIELAIRNVYQDNSEHPDLKAFRKYVQHYRPLLRANMAFLISNRPRLAQMVCEVIEVMMIREVDAFAFLTASVNLSLLREDDQPVRDILNDMMHPEPTLYLQPSDILKRLHESQVYIPHHMGKAPTPIPSKSMTEFADTTELVVAHPGGLCLPG